ncbi:MAG: helix-turn-helix domain-containing protein [Candidatus Bathyarchaeia archaeon]
MENDHFPGISEIRDFQLPGKQCFSNKAGHSTVNKASYRKVSVYTKSMKRYSKERERRRQVRLLAEAGHTQKQIASEIGVSTRTIKRDWNKIQSYVKGQTRKEIRQVVEERQQEFKRRYEGLTVNEELRLLKQDVKEAVKEARALRTIHRRQEQRQQTARQLDYTFDLDCLTVDGFPRVIVPPLGSIPFAGGVGMKFYAIKNGEKRELLNISISTTNNSPFH